MHCAAKLSAQCNNNHDDIYSAVIMTEVIAKVHSVHFMNAEQRQAAADPQTKPHDLGCESACRLPSSTNTIAIYYYYSALKLILIYRPTEGRRIDLNTAGRVRTARAQGCKSQWFRSQDLAHCSQACYR